MAVKGLWCHYPRNMNDPFECLGMLDRSFSANKIGEFREYVGKSHHPTLQTMKNSNDKELIEKLNEIRKKIIERYAFCSLSETYDDILMWSHYSADHTSVVMEYEFPELSENHHLQKVYYVDSLPDFDLITFAKFIEGDDQYLNYFLKDISVKSCDWSREKEWRIWRKDPKYYRYKPEHVKEIYFGVSCAPQTKIVVMELTSYLGDDFFYYNMGFRDNPVRLVRE